MPKSKPRLISPPRKPINRDYLSEGYKYFLLNDPRMTNKNIAVALGAEDYTADGTADCEFGGFIDHEMSTVAYREGGSLYAAITQRSPVDLARAIARAK